MSTSASPVALLLEDEALIAIHVESLLEDAGFSVVLFATCTEAEQWLEANTPTIAVIDISLSDGLCVKAAQMLVDRRVPFVVHSGDMENSSHLDEVFLAGTWIGKPADPERFSETVRTLAGLSEA